MGESRLSSAPGSRLLGALREKWRSTTPEHTSPSGHQCIFIKFPPSQKAKTDDGQTTDNGRSSSRKGLAPVVAGISRVSLP